MSRRRELTIAALVVLVAVAAWWVPLGTWVSALAERLRGMGAAGVVLFVTVYVVAEVALVPGSLLTLVAGFAYGPVKGLLVASPASVLAAVTAFLLSRTVLRRWAQARLAHTPTGRAIVRAVSRNAFKLILLLRLSPMIPFNILNYALGLSDARMGPYIVASFVGMLPGTWLYVYLGSLAPTAARLSHSGRDGGLARIVLTIVGLAATVGAVALATRAARSALKAELEGPS